LSFPAPQRVGFLLSSPHPFVIPAKAGIHFFYYYPLLYATPYPLYANIRSTLNIISLVLSHFSIAQMPKKPYHPHKIQYFDIVILTKGFSTMG